LKRKPGSTKTSGQRRKAFPSTKAGMLGRAAGRYKEKHAQKAKARKQSEHPGSKKGTGLKNTIGS